MIDSDIAQRGTSKEGFDMSISVFNNRRSVDNLSINENDSHSHYTIGSPPGDKQSFQIGEIRKNAPALRFKVGLNHKIVGKTNPQNLSHAGAWAAEEITLEGLAEHIGAGHPWMPAVLDGNGKRWSTNSNYAAVLALDFDNGLTIEEFKEHPWAQYCGLVIESSSSTPEHQKFRSVFVLPSAITGHRDISANLRYLMAQFPQADQSCKDPARLFFGGLGRTPALLQQVTLPESFVGDAWAWDAELERQAQIQRDRRAEYLATLDISDRAALAKEALEFIPPYTKGHGTYKDLIVMMAGVINDLGAEGEALLEAWNGFGRETAKKVQGLGSTPNKKATLGSLFHLAKEHGFKFPHREFTPEQKRAYAKLKAEERREQQEQRQQNPLINWIESATNWAKKGLEQRQQDWRGFAKQQQPKAATEVAPTFNYFPGNLSDRQPGQVVRYQRDDLQQLLIEVKLSGIRRVLDKTRAGVGKSTEYGNLDYSPLEPDHVFWFSPQHRNPTTLGVEVNFVDLPVRHSAMQLDHERLTPSGKPRRTIGIAEDIGTNGTIEGNCDLAELFAMAASKGIEAAADSASSNPICKGCPYFGDCAQSDGLGYGFRYQRRKHFSNETKHRLHLDSAPSPLDFDYSNGIALLDEDQLTPTKTVSVSVDSVQRTFAKLELDDVATYDALSPLRRRLLELLTDVTLRDRYGIDSKQMPDRFSDIDLTGEAIQRAIDKTVVELQDLESIVDSAELVNLTREIASLTQKIQRRIAKIDSAKDIFEEERLRLEVADLDAQRAKLTKQRETLRAYNKSQRKGARAEFLKRLNESPAQWLPNLLKILTGQINGALRINQFGDLVITTYNPRQNAVLDQVGLEIHLDATGNPEILAAKRQIDPSEILVIEMAAEVPDNLSVYHVKGLGLASLTYDRESGEMARTKDCLRRIEALKAELTPSVIFDRKAGKEATGAVGHWFSDHTRGTNDYAGAERVMAIGIPMPNWGAVEDECRALGIADSRKYYTHKIDAEIVQCVARARAVQNPDQQFEFYLVGDTDKSKKFRYELPAELNPIVVQAIDITIEAGSKSQVFFAKARKAILELEAKGKKVTQTAVAKACEVSQQYVSTLWEKLQQTLYSSLYRESCNNCPVDAEEQKKLIEADIKSGLDPYEVVKSLYDRLKNAKFFDPPNPDPDSEFEFEYVFTYETPDFEEVFSFEWSEETGLVDLTA